MLADILQLFLVVFAGALLAQSIFNIYVTLYAWDHVKRLRKARAPRTFEKPKHGFTVLLPARHEAAVIGETLRRLSEANYPKDLLELMVICTEDDASTISAAKNAVRRYKISNASVVAFPGKPGKSKGMNIGLAAAKHQLVTIFDSEDDVSQEIFNIANTIYIRKKVDVLQGGVQLMDFNTKWYSAHNVLEYFFWFKSRMHYHADMDIVPLGGNTVFFRASDLKEVGGWDEVGLTEDADIGIRLSIAGKKFGVMYDPRHVTKEETPHTAAAFIKQRTRWNQGFLQILAKGDWKKLDSPKKKMLILYVLGAPTFMSMVIAATPLMLLIGFLFKLPVAISLLTFVPLFMSMVVMLMSIIGLHEFGRDQHVKIRLRHYAMLIVTFLPYQFLLTVSALRAFMREARGNRGWEKTVHLGQHRREGASGQKVAEPEGAV